MPRSINVFSLEELSNKETPEEIIIVPANGTQIHVEVFRNKKTVISFPFGNKFDVVNNKIIVHPEQ